MIMSREGIRGAGVFRDNDAYEWRDTAGAGAEQGGRVAEAGDCNSSSNSSYPSSIFCCLVMI